MWNKIEYKQVQALGVTINYMGDAIARTYGIRQGPYLGKDAYINSNNDSFESAIIDCFYLTYKPKPGTGQKLYVCKESKLPRALLRGSDYKIVLDKDNADYIIFPYPHKIVTNHYNLLAIDDDKNLYKIQISKEIGVSCITPNIIENVKDAVRIKLGRNDLQFFHKNELEPCTVYFAKKCGIYIDILNNSVNKRCYPDIRCPFVPMMEINPENLEFLYRCNDHAVFEKTVFGSDWQKYPLTICVLFDMKPDYYGPASLRLVEEAIGYDRYMGGKVGFRNANKIITAEDWNMCQRWLMMRAGLDEENGGMMKPRRYNELDSEIKDFLHSMTMIKPMYIKEDLPYTEIIESL